MLPVRQQYDRVAMTAESSVTLVHDGDTVVVPVAAGEPPEFLEALSERRHEVRDVTVSQLLPMRSYDYLSPYTVGNIRLNSFFVAPPARLGAREGWVDVTPTHFSEVPNLYRRGDIHADVAVSIASPMDEHGYFAISLGPAYTMAAIKAARTVILEVNPGVPYAAGHCHVHVSRVDAVVESARPIATIQPLPIGDVERAIARYVADLIPDGATLQIGIGAIPEAVVSLLGTKNDLGIHTELLNDGIMKLARAGVVTGLRKNVHIGKMIAAFALGSPELYRFMHRNPSVEMHPVDVTNTPHIAGLNDNLHSINSSISVDFAGQCGSESMGPVPYSGTGGQADFVRAAAISKGGKSFIVLPSTAKGGTVSRIVPMLAPGTHVSTHKNDVDYVVTEWGIVRLRGRSLRDRARALIEIAHPDFRPELHEAARAMHLA
jgi:acyl-CoA hydrolase